MFRIKTKFYGPTNFRGARIKVTLLGYNISRMMNYPYEASQSHEAVIIEFLGKPTGNKYVDMDREQAVDDMRNGRFVAAEDDDGTRFYIIGAEHCKRG